MKQIEAKVIADSINEHGNRITTMVCTFPRMILAEFNTHRMFSRNSASSRAIPFKKMVKMVEEEPFIPIAWQKDHKGMQGTEYFESALEIDRRRGHWLRARDKAIDAAIRLSDLGITKQLCNRLLEPFMWHTVIVTATEWENFFALRCPQYEIAGTHFRSKKDTIKQFPICEDGAAFDWLQCNKGQAEIHMMALAEAMWDAYNESKPKELKPGQWHIPFGDSIDILTLCQAIKINETYPPEQEPEGYRTEERFNEIIEANKVKIAVARCARISYQTLGDNPKMDLEADIKLHDRLLQAGHMSPFEHCAQVNEYLGDDWSGNFRGFVQYRKMIPNENRI